MNFHDLSLHEAVHTVSTALGVRAGGGPRPPAAQSPCRVSTAFRKRFSCHVGTPR